MPLKVAVGALVYGTVQWYDYQWDATRLGWTAAYGEGDPHNPSIWVIFNPTLDYARILIAIGLTSKKFRDGDLVGFFPRWVKLSDLTLGPLHLAGVSTDIMRRFWGLGFSRLGEIVKQPPRPNCGHGFTGFIKGRRVLGRLEEGEYVLYGNQTLIHKLGRGKAILLNDLTWESLGFQMIPVRRKDPPPNWEFVQFQTPPTQVAKRSILERDAAPRKKKRKLVPRHESPIASTPEQDTLDDASEQNTLDESHEQDALGETLKQDTLDKAPERDALDESHERSGEPFSPRRTPMTPGQHEMSSPKHVLTPPRSFPRTNSHEERDTAFFRQHSELLTPTHFITETTDPNEMGPNQWVAINHESRASNPDQSDTDVYDRSGFRQPLSLLRTPSPGPGPWFDQENRAPDLPFEILDDNSSETADEAQEG